MSGYIRFFVKYLRPVGFAASLNFASSFGQTFMVSQFVPFLLEELHLSNTAFGGIYSAATLVSAALLLKTGKRVDRAPLDRYTVEAAFILCAAAAALAGTVHPAMLFAALFGLRFAGQGLMSNISQTAMARHFQKSRGKALSLASLGYSAGELAIPIALTTLFPLIGWRLSLTALSVLSLFFLIALTRLLPIRSFERPDPDDLDPYNRPEANPAVKFRALKDGSFWFLVLPGWVFTFMATGYFFYQMVLVRDKGWDPRWYALVFGVYALVRVAATFGAGFLVDRFGARFLYPLHFAPIIAGCAAMGFSGSSAALAVFMIGMGATMGASSVLQSAALAETYGAEIVGTVRSVFASVMIFGASAGPAVFGASLDAGVSMERMLLSVAAATTVAAVLSFKTWRRPRPAARR